MNCEDFESNVADLAREQMMEASVLAQALEHHEKCEACAQQLDDQRSLSFGLTAWDGTFRRWRLTAVR